MNTRIGLWIDHRAAVIVTVTAAGETLTRLASGLGPPVRFSSRAEPLTAEDMLDRRYANHLHQYYEQVIAAVRAADELLILGPGEAKGELAKQLQAAHFGGRIVAVEAADKLTDRQIAARVRQQFAPVG